MLFTSITNMSPPAPSMMKPKLPCWSNVVGSSLLFTNPTLDCIIDQGIHSSHLGLSHFTIFISALCPLESLSFFLPLNPLTPFNNHFWACELVPLFHSLLCEWLEVLYLVHPLSGRVCHSRCKCQSKLLGPSLLSFLSKTTLRMPLLSFMNVLSFYCCDSALPE